MRIRKRTPARAASPGPSPALSVSPLPAPPLPPLLPKERACGEEDEEEAEAEEKRVILVEPGDQEDDRVPAPSNSKNSAMGDAPKPELEPAGAAARCSRNDGKRWRCKNAVVPGYLFCDRHVAWSTRKRKPRAKKHKNHHGGGVLEPTTNTKEDLEAAAAAEEDDAARTPRPGCDAGDNGFHYYGGFQPGSRKRARGGGPGPAA